MVYYERTDKCSTSPQDIPQGQSKTNSSSSSSTSHSSSPTHKPSHSSGAWSSQASNEEKWKYNNMVKDNRDKFNNMHFS